MININQSLLFLLLAGMGVGMPLSSFFNSDQCQSHNNSVNTYWPGDFEQSALYGGCFSNAKNIRINDSINAGPEGNHCWELFPAEYSHLELLTFAHGTYRLSFMGKASTSAEVVIKPVKKDSTGKSTTDYKTVLISDGKWHRYETEFTVVNPYPGPDKGEVLIACYNATERSAYIDNIELIPQFETKKNDQITVSNKTTIIGDVTPVRMGFDSTNIKTQITEVLDASNIAGKKIRLTFSAGFENIDERSFPWSGVVVSLRNGNDIKSDLIQATPKPHWYVAALASPPGTKKEISALYQIPDDATELLLEIKAQNKMKPNICVVDEVWFSVLE